MKKYYDRTVRNQKFNVNDLVLWHVMAKGVGTSKKLNPKWKGPFKILRITDPNVVIVDCYGNSKLIHKNHLKRFFGDGPLAELRFRGRPCTRLGGGMLPRG